MLCVGVCMNPVSGSVTLHLILLKQSLPPNLVRTGSVAANKSQESPHIFLQMLTHGMQTCSIYCFFCVCVFVCV